MYLIEYVKEDLDYEAYEQRDEYFKLGYVESEELAREICNTYGINFEYTKQDVYDSAQEFFKDHVKWENTIYLTVDMKKEEVKFEMSSYPSYEDEVYKKNHYQVDISGRHAIIINVAFNTDDKPKNIQQDSIRYFAKYLFRSGITDKKKFAEPFLNLLVDEINKQFNANVSIRERTKLKSFGSGEYDLE